MKAILLAGTLAFTAAINPASAQAPPAQLPPIPVWNWTGFYIGANFGGGWSNSNWTNTLTGTLGNIQRSASNSNGSNGGGVFGGGQIGYNYELPSRLVAGIEADIDGAHITSSKAACQTVITVVCGTRDGKITDFGTVRARLGYDFENVLVYGTGGWAWGHSTNTTQVTCLGSECPGTSSLTPQSPINSIGETASGWAAGVGVDWGFLSNWTLRAEYIHLQFNGVTEEGSLLGGPARPVLVTSHLSSNLGINAVRVGVNYLFNWP